MNTIEKERMPKVLVDLMENCDDEISINALCYTDDKDSIHIVDKDENGYVLRGYTKEHKSIYTISFNSKESAINHLERYWKADNIKMEEVEKSTTDNCIWQTLMDVPYELFKNGEYSSYMEMLKDCSELERDAINLGKLNQQVNNGGFYQWVDNGYAYDIRYTLIALDKVHDWALKKYMGTGKYNNALSEIKQILIMMLPYIEENPINTDRWIYSEDDYEKDCDWCGGEGTMMEAKLYPQGHTEVDVECEECGGLGYTNEYDQYCHGIEIAKNGDEKFYEFNDEFVKVVCEYFESKIV